MRINHTTCETALKPFNKARNVVNITVVFEIYNSYIGRNKKKPLGNRTIVRDIFEIEI